MKSRRWKRGERAYRYDNRLAQAIIFGAVDTCLWAWVVWFEGGRHLGVETNLQRARREANRALDDIEGEARPGV